MKTLKIYCIWVTALMGLLLAACRTDDDIAETASDNLQGIELQFVSDDMPTKAIVGSKPFTDEEAKIRKVDLFFYKAGDAVDIKPVKVYRPTDVEYGTKFKVLLSNTELEDLFGSADVSGSCRVYAVVNVGSPDDDTYNVIGKSGIDTKAKTELTIADLRNIKVSTKTFATKFDGFALFTKADGGDLVQYDASNRQATGTIKVKNLAAKIGLLVNITKNIEDPKGATLKVYNPEKTQDHEGTAEVYMVNGATAVKLQGWTNDDYNNHLVSSFLTNDDYYDSRDNNGTYSRHLNKAKTEDSDYCIDGFFYSYPTEWTTDVLEQHRAYLLVKVNWIPDEIPDEADDETIMKNLRETYYRVPINMNGDSENKLLSNRYYRVKININSLGGINFGEPLELKDCSWEVLDWGQANVDTDIREVRWLEVPQIQEDVNDGKTYTAVMYNTSQVTIPYNSSHKVEIADVKMTYWIYTEEADQYAPVKTNVLRYRTSANKKTATWAGNNALGIDRTIFTLDDTKLEAYKQEEKETDREPQGVYIDELNHTITFYHSPYALRGDAGKGRYFRDGIKNYSPYDITFTLRHKDDNNVATQITIKQYPGVYITHELNDGNVGYKTTNGGLGTQNRGSVYVNGGATNNWGDNKNRWWGDLATYGNDDLECNVSQLGGVGGRGNADNKNMYSIHVTQLDEDDQPVSRNGNKAKLVIWSMGEVDVTYHIGDPRAKYVNNQLYGSQDLTDIQNIYDKWGKGSGNVNVTSNTYREPTATESLGAQRLYPHTTEEGNQSTTLEYYYPTKESQLLEDAFMLAPVFRLNSGYAEVRNRGDNMPREYARQRCASFQEQGYPAGRWRLPTIGEFYFIRQLYVKGILPDMFGSDDDRAYWGAQYCFKVDKNSADVRDYPNNDLPSGEKRVRCVYDDWYWVKSDNMTPDNNQNNTDKLKKASPYDKYMKNSQDFRELFVWGDKLKNNPQDQQDQ